MMSSMSDADVRVNPAQIREIILISELAAPPSDRDQRGLVEQAFAASNNRSVAEFGRAGISLRYVHASDFDAALYELCPPGKDTSYFVQAGRSAEPGSSRVTRYAVITAVDNGAGNVVFLTGRVLPGADSHEPAPTTPGADDGALGPEPEFGADLTAIDDVGPVAGVEDDAPKSKATPRKARRQKYAGPFRKPRADVYTVMLLISLMAIAAGILCLYLEVEKYGNPPFKGGPSVSLSADLPAVVATANPLVSCPSMADSLPTPFHG